MNEITVGSKELVKVKCEVTVVCDSPLMAEMLKKSPRSIHMIQKLHPGKVIIKGVEIEDVEIIDGSISNTDAVKMVKSRTPKI